MSRHYRSLLNPNVATRVLPTLNLQSTQKLEDYPLVNLSRSSEQTYFDSNGILQTASANSLPPSYEYNSATGLWERKGWGIWEQRTNLILDSRDLTTGNWTKEFSPTIAQDAIGLDGNANTASTVTSTGGSNAESVRQDISVSDDSLTRTASIWVKKNETEDAYIRGRYFGGTELNYYIRFDTTDGTISPVGDATSSDIDIEDWGNWWRLELNCANNGTGNTTFRIYVIPDLVKDGTPRTVTVGQIQVEQASFPSPPIITNGSTVTRSATLANITDLSWYNPDEGTFVVEANAISRGGWELFDSNTFRQYQAAGNWVLGYPYSGGSEFQIINSLTDDVLFKTAFSFSDGEAINISHNGGAIITTPENYVSSGLGSLRLLESGFNGYLKSLKYYPKRLSNS